ncbi:hypothetical protein ACVWYQ_003553 [Bradyrhizobium sp. USDA 3397]
MIDPVFLPPFSQVTGGRMAALQLGRIVRRHLGERAAYLERIFDVGRLGAGWCARLGNLLNQFTEICQNTASLAVMHVFILFSGHSRALKITM